MSATNPLMDPNHPAAKAQAEFIAKFNAEIPPSHPIVQKWRRGENDAGGCIAELEREVQRLEASRPRVWDSETIKDAPLGNYHAKFLHAGWDPRMMYTREEIITGRYGKIIAAYGPIPMPLVGEIKGEDHDL